MANVVCLFFFNKGTKYAVVEIEVVQLLSRV